MELTKQRFEDADTRQEYLDGSIAEVARIGGRVVARATFRAGHTWSEHVKPLAGTRSCEEGHVGYVVSGGFVVRMDDGDEQHFRAGDLYCIPPGHDAEIVGGEPCVCIELGPPRGNA